MPIITVDDLPAKAQEHELVLSMVAGANALTSRVAPCLVDTDPAPSEDQLAEARLVLIGMVQRWSEAGSGAFSQESAGIFSQSVDTRSRTGMNPWPSEIQRLQAICTTGKSGAFSVDTAPSGLLHLPWCDLYFGGTTCSCGVDIAGYPIFEGA